ncbi:MAG: SEL1-like repeat protein [Candidatus Competibacteraceae bacterium]
MPPELDYAEVCVSESGLEVDNRGLDRWDGQRSRIPPEELLEIGLLYQKGSSRVARDHRVALRIFEYLAKQSWSKQAHAKYKLADLLLDGEGVPANPQRAAQLLIEAVRFQVSGAAAMLGELYAAGLGVEQDYPKAAAYFRTAAAANDPDAALALARLYGEGLVAAPSPNAAEEMAQFAQLMLMTRLGQGDCSALHRIGMLYLNGEHVSRDENVAARWLAAAVQAGEEHALLVLANLYRRGVGIEGSLGATRAIELWRTAAQRGSSQAMYELGRALLLGDGIAADRAQAEHWLAESGEHGHGQAMELLAHVYRGDYGEPRDLSRYVHWLERAAQLRPIRRGVVSDLAEAYEQGLGVERDDARALELYRQAAEAGGRTALVALAQFYRDGRAGQRDEIKSLRLFRQAASHGSVTALEAMVDIYTCGIGVEPDPQKARKWLDRASEQGSTISLLTLAERSALSDTPDAQARRFLFLKRAANAGNRSAMVELGLAYRDGLGVAVDAELSREWLERATAPGNNAGHGMMRLARAYAEGEEFEQDRAKSQRWVEQAAETGYPSALRELGRRYWRGEGVSADPARAVQWLNRAADNGESKAMLDLAEFYAGRLGEQGAANQALFWLEKAAGAGEIKAMLELARRAAASPDDADKVQASNWLARAAQTPPCDFGTALDVAQAYFDGLSGQHNSEQGRFWVKRALQHFPPDEDDYYRLARIHRRGIGVPPDPAKALTYLKKAADLGQARAMRELGKAYLTGWGGDPDPAEALRWFRQAVERGDEEAHFELAMAYRNQVGGEDEQHSPEAVWAAMKTAAENGSIRAMRELGRWYQRGFGVAINPAESVRWFTRAAEQGDTAAMRELATAYAVGLGVLQSLQESRAWLERAAQRGDAQAIASLNRLYGAESPDPTITPSFDTAATQSDDPAAEQN